VASKGPIITAGAVTGALLFWRKKRKKKAAEAKKPGAEGEVASEDVTADA
jgi:hypothetical protein